MSWSWASQTKKFKSPLISTWLLFTRLLKFFCVFPNFGFATMYYKLDCSIMRRSQCILLVCMVYACHFITTYSLLTTPIQMPHFGVRPHVRTLQSRSPRTNKKTELYLADRAYEERLVIKPKKIMVLGGDGFCGWPTALYLADLGAYVDKICYNICISIVYD